MSNRHVILEWEVLPDDQVEWDLRKTMNAQQGRKPMPPVAWQSPRILWAIAGIVLLVLAAGANTLWNTAQLGLDQIYGELQATVEADNLDSLNQSESQRDATGSDWPQDALPAPAIAVPSNSDKAPQPRVTVGTVSLGEGLAMIEVTVDASGAWPYRETQFYREGQNGEWLRTSATERFWGTKRSLETPFFTINYFDRDAAAVRAMTAELDTLYANLRRDMGLSSPMGKLVIDVMPVPLSQVHYQQFMDGRLLVPSPFMLQIPIDLTDEVILTQSIINPLVEEVTQQTTSRPTWRKLVFGLQLWEAHMAAPPLSLSFWDMASWLDDDTQTVRPDRFVVTDQDLDRVCRSYQIWRYSLPVILYPPKFCSKRDETLRERRMALAGPLPAKLNLIYADWGWQSCWADVPDEQVDVSGNFMREIAAATLIDYVVQAFGRERLPDLMAAMRVYDTWNRLAPAVLGISAKLIMRAAGRPTCALIMSFANSRHMRRSPPPCRNVAFDTEALGRWHIRRFCCKKSVLG